MLRYHNKKIVARPAYVHVGSAAAVALAQGTSALSRCVLYSSHSGYGQTRSLATAPTNDSFGSEDQPIPKPM
jgi:hypothetical protein